MSISVFPTPSTAVPDAYTITASTAQTDYRVSSVFQLGVYEIKLTPAVTVNISVTTATSVILDTAISSSPTTINIAQTPTAVYFRASTSAVDITFSKLSEPITPTAPTGTLDTVNSTSAYNETGLLYVMCVGGGGGGGGGAKSDSIGSGGGGSGGVASKYVYTTTATTVTIGAAGNGGINGSANTNQPGNAGGATSFGNFLTVNGGGGGKGGSDVFNNPANSGGAAGTPGGSTGGIGARPGNGFDGGTGGATEKRVTIKGNDTTGSGGGGDNVARAGGGSGIGTGGSGGANAQSGSAGTGKGSGGGGAGLGLLGNNAVGGAGQAGVVYILRGF